MFQQVGETVLHSVRRWADPHERHLRKTRRARRRSIRYGTASGVTAVGAAGLVVAAAPAWAVVITTGGAALLVVPAALAARKYRTLRASAGPAPMLPSALPPHGSAAREPIARLGQLERSLADILTVVARSARVPAHELVDVTDTARSAGAALRSLSVDIVALERATKRIGGVSPELHNAVMAAIGELDAGIREFERLVGAAARMTPLGSSTPTWDAPGEALRVAADRLDGWADALAELHAAPYGGQP